MKVLPCVSSGQLLMAVSLSDFCAALTDLNLVSGEEFRDIMKSLASGQLANVELLSKALVARQMLTKYQAQAILSGQAKRLVLGSYLLTDQIGKGGMGVVLKARHLRLKRIVAIKVLSPQVTKDPAALKRFQREVQAISKLEHPNIVAAFDADVSRGVHFLVMQFVDGRDLATTVQEQGPLSVQLAVKCLSQAAHGLEYAHKQGITHRDIKPANLLLDRGTGTIKVLDMGLARVDDALGGSNDETGLTNTGAIMGTVDYMSPEQALNTKMADHRSDIYSLGITFFYLLTGQLPYEGTSAMEKLLAHREQPIPNLGDYRTDIPIAVDALFRKMVAKNPDHRFQSMSEVLTALLACLSDAPTTVAVPTTQRAVVAEDSVNSEFRAFVTGLGKVEDTDANFVPGQPTEINANSPLIAVRDEPHKPRSSRSGSQLKLAGKRTAIPLWMWIAGTAVLVLVIIGGGLSQRGGKGKFTKRPVVAKSDEPGSETATDDPSTELDPGSSPKVDTASNDPGIKTAEIQPSRLTIPLGNVPALVKLPPLPAGDHAAKLFGLAVEPGKVAGSRRWQVDTVAPRAPLNCCTWSPNSQQVVVGSQAGELRVYDVPSWKLRSVMIGHPGGVRNVAWNRDGSRIASSGNDNTVRLWQADGTPGPTLRQCPRPDELAWSPDGQYLIAASTDPNRPFVQMFTAEGKPHRVFSGHTSSVRGLAWSLDGQHFISASEDATLRVWDLKGETVAEITGHDRGLVMLAWSPTGAIATVDANGTVYIYPDMSKPPSITRKVFPRMLAWNAAGDRLAIGLNGQIQLWDSDGQMNLKQAYLESQAIAWSPNGKWLIGCGQSAAIWEPEGSDGTVNSLASPARPTSVDMDAHTGQVVSGHATGALQWWRPDGETVRATSIGDFPVSSVAWNADGTHLASGSHNEIRLWSSQGQPGISIIAAPDILQVKWSRDGKLLAATCSDSIVHLWEVDGTAGPLLEGHQRGVTGVDWSLNGQLATAGGDGSVRLWGKDGAAGPVIELTPKNLDLSATAWSSDGQQFAVNLGNRSEARLQIWTADGTDGPTLKGPKNILSFAWSPDGQQVMGSDSSGDFRLWSRDGRAGPTFPGPGIAAKYLSWSKSDRLITTGDDHVLRYWDATNFKPLWLAVTLSDGNTVTLSPEGKVLHWNGNVEQTVAYIVERSDGRLDIHSPESFDKLQN